MAEQPNPPKQARAQAVKPTAVPRPKADDDSAPDAGEPAERRTAADQVPLCRPRSLPRTGLVTPTRSRDRDQRPTAQRLLGKDWARPHGKACRTHTADPLGSTSPNARESCCRLHAITAPPAKRA